MRRHTLSATIGINIGIFKFEVEKSIEWGKFTGQFSNENESFCYLDSLWQMQNDMRNLKTRFAVFEKELPRLISFRSENQQRFRNLLIDTNQVATDLKLDTGIISLPQKVDSSPLRYLSVLNPTTSLPVRTVLRNSIKPNLFNSPLSNLSPSLIQKSGRIGFIWMEHNSYVYNEKGMKIHFMFTVTNVRNVRCFAAAYFESQFGGLKLRDYNNRCCTTDGYVAVHKDFTPEYDSTTYNDFQLFIPYSELHLDNGKIHSLRFFINLCDYPEYTYFVRSQYVNFSVSTLFGLMGM